MNSKKILILEDDDSLLDAMDNLVTLFGYEAYSISDLYNSPPLEPGKTIDVAIIDLSISDIPPELVLKHVKQIFQPENIILFTGNEQLIRQFAPQVDAVLPKLFELEKFESMLKALLAKSGE